MKRLFSILICVAVILSLCACGSVETAPALRHKVSSKVDSQTVKDANRYAVILKENIAAADEAYDTDVGFVQYTFNHGEMQALSDAIKEREGVADASDYRYDLIKIAYIMTSINYCTHSYSGEEIYNQALSLLGIDSEGLTSNLEKSQAITDYAKQESEHFLKKYYRTSIDPKSLMALFKKASRSEEASSSS